MSGCRSKAEWENLEKRRKEDNPRMYVVDELAMQKVGGSKEDRATGWLDVAG